MATWYRGESTVAAPAQAGGFLQDFGDGVYFTNELHVARFYADKRVKESGGEQQIYRLEFEPVRRLDLRTDGRWLKSVQGLEPHIRASNENYGRIFQNFIRQHNINLNEIDAVIGPEYLNGGIQMAILHKNGQPSTLARGARAMMQPLSGRPPRLVALPRSQNMRTVGLRNWMASRGTPGFRGPVPMRGAQEFYQQQAQNQNAWAYVGMKIAGAIHDLNNRAIQAQVQSQLETMYKDQVERTLAGGQGVLVIINIQEPILEDVNGYRSRVLRSIVLKSGPSSEVTLNGWNSENRFGIGPDPNCRIVEEYLWLDPHQ